MAFFIVGSFLDAVGTSPIEASMTYIYSFIDAWMRPGGSHRIELDRRTGQPQWESPELHTG